MIITNEFNNCKSAQSIQSVVVKWIDECKCIFIDLEMKLIVALCRGTIQFYAMHNMQRWRILYISLWSGLCSNNLCIQFKIVKCTQHNTSVKYFMVCAIHHATWYTAVKSYQATIENHRTLLCGISSQIVFIYASIFQKLHSI